MTLRPVEPYAPLEPVSTCDPTPKPGVTAFRDFTLANWGGSSGGIARDCSIGSPSKHWEGRAWDWFPPNSGTADQWINQLLEHGPDDEPEELARRAGLRTIIWEGRIWIAGQGWIPYSKSPHNDHVHFGFGWDGANGRTSFYHQTEGGPLRVLPFCPGVDPSPRGGVGLASTDMSPADYQGDTPSEPGPADIYEAIDDA